MGEIAARLADIAVVTDDNPRGAVLEKLAQSQDFAFHPTFHLLFPGFQFAGRNSFDQRGLIIPVFEKPRRADQVDNHIRMQGLLQHLGVLHLHQVGAAIALQRSRQLAQALGLGAGGRQQRLGGVLGLVERRVGGLLGGAISSTATTVSYARRSRETPSSTPAAARSNSSWKADRRRSSWSASATGDRGSRI